MCEILIYFFHFVNYLTRMKDIMRHGAVCASKRNRMLRKFGHGRFLCVEDHRVPPLVEKRGHSLRKENVPFSWSFCAGRSLTFHLSGSLDRFVQHLRVELVEFRAGGDDGALHAAGEEVRKVGLAHRIRGGGLVERQTEQNMIA